MKRFAPLLALFLAACTAAPNDSQIQTAIAQTQGAAPKPTSVPPTETTAATPTPEPSNTPTQSPVGMSRSNPAPAGSEITTSQLTISGVEGVRPANEAIAAENMFNPEPKPGEEYLLIRVAIKCNLGPDEQCDYFAISVFSLVLPDGNILKEGLVAGDNLLGHEQHFGGSTAKGLLAFMVAQTDKDFIMMINPGHGEPMHYLNFDITSAN